MKNVPKKIHLLWFGDREPIVPYLAKIREVYSDYQIKLWTEADFDMENLSPFVKYAYDKKQWRHVSNYFRMKVLFEEGGIYISSDMEPMKKFDLDSDAKIFVGYEHRNNLTTGFFACSKENLFPKAVMEYYDSIRLPNHLPSLNVIWTEIIYSLYPGLGEENSTKKYRDLQIMDKDSFGLYKSNKEESYFIHRQSFEVDENVKLKKMKTSILNVLSPIIPGFVQNIKVNKERKLTEKKSKATLHFNRTNQLVTIIEDAGYLTKEAFENILSFKQGVKVHLHYKNETLKKTLLKIYNVKEVTFGSQVTSFDYKDVKPLELGNTNTINKNKEELVFRIKKFNGRSNVETMTNVYSRLFNDGYQKILYK